MRRLLPILFCLFLSGCVQLAGGQSINWDAANAPMMQFNVIRDDSKKLVTYEGPNCSEKPMSALFLRAVAEDGIPTSYVIYITDHYYDHVWHMYDIATDSDGHSLLLHVLARQESYCDEYGCAKDERVMIRVSREYLMQHEVNGLRFQIEGRHGSEVYFLPGGYIGAFLRQAP